MGCTIFGPQAIGTGQTSTYSELPRGLGWNANTLRLGPAAHQSSTLPLWKANELSNCLPLIQQVLCGKRVRFHKITSSCSFLIIKAIRVLCRKTGKQLRLKELSFNGKEKKSKGKYIGKQFNIYTGREVKGSKNNINNVEIILYITVAHAQIVQLWLLPSTHFLSATHIQSQNFQM